MSETTETTVRKLARVLVDLGVPVRASDDRDGWTTVWTIPAWAETLWLSVSGHGALDDRAVELAARDEEARAAMLAVFDAEGWDRTRGCSPALRAYLESVLPPGSPKPVDG